MRGGKCGGEMKETKARCAEAGARKETYERVLLKRTLKHEKRPAKGLTHAQGPTLKTKKVHVKRPAANLEIVMFIE
jgi:hypothetical protein